MKTQVSLTVNKLTVSVAGVDLDWFLGIFEGVHLLYRDLNLFSQQLEKKTIDYKPQADS